MFWLEIESRQPALHIWPTQGFFFFPHIFKSLWSLPFPNIFPPGPPHICVFCLSLEVFISTVQPSSETSHFTGKETHGNRWYNWVPQIQSAAEVRQEFTSTDSKSADKRRRQSNIISLIILPSTQPYRSDRSLSNPSSWKGHSFLDNSLGTICQWKHGVCKHGFQKIWTVSRIIH